jgi:hypothetical protein
VTTSTAPPPSPPTDDAPRGRSGTAFVIICAALAVGFVLFIIFVSPILLERTQRLAPPPAPQVVASGELPSGLWSAEAHDASEPLRGVDDRGFERIVEPEPCLRFTVDGAEAVEVCTTRRGESIRGLDTLVDGDLGAVAYGIVAPEVSELRLRRADGEELVVTPSYVDFGFPLGFFALEVDAEQRITTVVATDRDGQERARAVCQEPPLRGCTATEVPRR